MIKKILAMMVALAIFTMPAALCADGRLKREREAYFGENAVHDGNIGAVIYWGFYAPDMDIPECMGIDTLIVEFALPGVAGGEGYFRVLNAGDDSLFFECQGSDPECVDFQASEMGGTNMYITLDEPLESGERYYLQFDEGLAISDGGLLSSAMDGKEELQMLVGDFGLDEMGMADEYHIGVAAPMPVILGSMGRAVIEADEAFVSLDMSELNEDGVVWITPVKAGDSEVNVSFYDASGKYVNGLIVPVWAEN